MKVIDSVSIDTEVLLNFATTMKRQSNIYSIISAGFLLNCNSQTVIGNDQRMPTNSPLIKVMPRQKIFWGFSIHMIKEV